jgi:hypothetical protein
MSFSRILLVSVCMFHSLTRAEMNGAQSQTQSPHQGLMKRGPADFMNGNDDQIQRSLQDLIQQWMGKFSSGRVVGFPQTSQQQSQSTPQGPVAVLGNNVKIS